MRTNTNVLIVEDNPADWYLWKELFSETENVPNVHWVKDGTEALDFIAKRHEYGHAALPDIIMLDLSLPRIDGYQLLQLLKNDARAAHIPVIVCTTSKADSDRNQCSDLGAILFLTKPPGLDEWQKMASHLADNEFPKLVKG